MNEIKKAQLQPSVVPAPITYDLLCKESKIQRSIDVIPEGYLEDLQTSQMVIISPKKVEPPRRSKSNHFQREPLNPIGLVTRSQTRKHANRQLCLHSKTLILIH